MIARLCTYLLLLGLLSALPACKDCGPSAEVEPQVELSLVASASTRFRLAEQVSAVYGLGALGQQPLFKAPNALDTTRFQSYQIKLPLNLRADQTRYVLVGQTRRDTLTVHYKRVFTYKDDQCGYLLEIQPPAGFQPGLPNPNTQIAAQTTLGRVSSVYYEGTRLVGNGWAPARLSDSGVYVTLLLP